ncbi:MAG: S-methyl-5-thioribose-1-phosphate isomerase, partial [Candidatus Brocadiae bacterium]|nr:S-methyl-5-thioribose-1-phosphate isomerase [Candidatus Brocadiia bacterium]
ALLASGRVGCVFTGADRIAANGDVANKIGTRAVALAAHDAGIPFYVAAPLTTFDPKTRTGASIRIEERAETEVLGAGTRATAPKGVRAWNPAFDVTPARLVTALICERGVLRPPFGSAIAAVTGRR